MQAQPLVARRVITYTPVAIHQFTVRKYCVNQWEGGELTLLPTRQQSQFKTIPTK